MSEETWDRDVSCRSALKSAHVSMKINGNSINNIRYSDDTLVIASSLLELKSLMDLIVEHSLHINTFNTKLVVFWKKLSLSFRIASFRILPVYHCDVIQLGLCVNQQSNTKVDRDQRKIWVSAETPQPYEDRLQIWLLRCYFFLVLSYEYESWTFHTTTENRIDAF